MKLNRGLKIAAIGDSVTAGFHISTDVDMFFRMWLAEKNSWFSEIIKRIEKNIPVKAHNFSSAGSKLADKIFGHFLDKLFHIKNMETQTSELLALGEFPDMTVVWIGHNDLNWLIKKDHDFVKIIANFREDFQKQLERLCQRAVKENKRAVIIVLGFISIRALFQIREMAGTAKEQNPALFPHFEKGYKMFPAMRPEYKEHTVKLADMMNKELERGAGFCENQYGGGKLRIVYSDILSRLSADSLEHVTTIDGWHPSAEGQRELADCVWPLVKEQLEFLGLSARL
ncbi:MAG: hypothetical protein A2751_00765 [Candidatus Doudnabacteria bacterium RIFCSPHIGHO2_01_FULL_46_14]|uniref:Uncharacterized protein n=1 Tax=Candidatus Doudnabacteria bacterium RIFCSPHIGHO2_01_FULL_46_14 TaxID=1817824 RepID=A0A1F5NMS2_9BACT|nr:MAG: hypothetical protein A2751_00765 [Candidatus Doudnabacteria bacterium RIFCSPHIGHO2_01_FULL_46_14]